MVRGTSAGFELFFLQDSANDKAKIPTIAFWKAARRKLAEETKKLREIPTAERSKAIGPLLKLKILWFVADKGLESIMQGTVDEANKSVEPLVVSFCPFCDILGK